MSLIFNNKILQIRKSSLHPWLESSIALSIDIPCIGNSSIPSTSPFWKCCEINFPIPNPYCPTKTLSKKLNQAPCTICYTSKVKIPSKGTTVDTNNLQLGEHIHVDFAFYNMTYICGFTSMLTTVCPKTRMLWLFPTAYKWCPVCIIRFILTTLKNEQHPYKCVGVDEYGDLVNSSFSPTNLLMTSSSLWKLLVVMHHIPIEIMNYTIE